VLLQRIAISKGNTYRTQEATQMLNRFDKKRHKDFNDKLTSEIEKKKYKKS